jgi:hypothetical protein
MEWGDSPWVAYFQTKPQGWMMGKWGNLGKTMGKTHHVFPVDVPLFKREQCPSNLRRFKTPAQTPSTFSDIMTYLQTKSIGVSPG